MHTQNPLRWLGNRQVVIYEAGPKCGLVGLQEQLAPGLAVDVPLRFMMPHYYQNLLEIIQDLHIPTKAVPYNASYQSGNEMLLVTSLGWLGHILQHLKYVSGPSLLEETDPLQFQMASAIGPHLGVHAFVWTQKLQTFAFFRVTQPPRCRTWLGWCSPVFSVRSCRVKASWSTWRDMAWRNTRPTESTAYIWAGCSPVHMRLGGEAGNCFFHISFWFENFPWSTDSNR